MFVLLVGCSRQTDTHFDESSVSELSTITPVNSLTTTSQTSELITSQSTTVKIVETAITTTVSTSSPAPGILFNADDIYIDAAERDERFCPISHINFDINADGFEDILLLVNNEMEGSIYCYLYDGERYSFTSDCPLPPRYYKYEPDIFENINPAEIYDEIKIYDFSYNGKTKKTILLSRLHSYEKINIIAEIKLDDSSKLSFNPLIEWGLEENNAYDGTYENITYRDYGDKTYAEYNSITAVHFNELTSDYFIKNNITFIPPEYNIMRIMHNSKRINDIFYYDEDYRTVYLIKDSKVLDTFCRGTVSDDFFYTSEYYKYDTINFDIPPYFNSANRMFNDYNDRISEVKFLVDGKNIFDLEYFPEYLHYVLKTGDNSFVVYFRDAYDYNIGINGKVEFTYNPANNCFEGEYRYNESPEAEKSVSDLYFKVENLDDRLAGYDEIKTEADGHDNTVQLEGYDYVYYSRAIEEGFRTPDELMTTLNTIFTPECSEEIYKIWTEKTKHYPLIFEKDNELYFYLHDGMGDGGWHEYYFDLISVTEDTIEARIVWIEYRGGSPYYDLVFPENMIIQMTPDGYRVSQNPFIFFYDHYWS
jgi:hypothetical protein